MTDAISPIKRIFPVSLQRRRVPESDGVKKADAPVLDASRQPLTRSPSVEIIPAMSIGQGPSSAPPELAISVYAAAVSAAETPAKEDQPSKPRRLQTFRC